MKFKKLLSFALATAMVLSFGTLQTGTINECGFPSTVLSVSAADGTGTLDNGLSYEITDGKAAITGCDISVTEIEIPAEIEGCPVTSIGDNTFYGCSLLIEIIIPDSMMSIGEYAFADCIKLKSVIIPDKVTFIGRGAFSNCRGLSKITILGDITSLEYATFEQCSKLTSLTLPDSVTKIGDHAFGYCIALTD